VQREPLERFSMSARISTFFYLLSDVSDQRLNLSMNNL